MALSAVMQWIWVWSSSIINWLWSGGTISVRQSGGQLESSCPDEHLDEDLVEALLEVRDDTIPRGDAIFRFEKRVFGFFSKLLESLPLLREPLLQGLGFRDYGLEFLVEGCGFGFKEFEGLRGPQAL